MKKLMLAMSGGVDSSVSLVLLKDEYEISGVTLQLYDNTDLSEHEGSCCSLSDVEDARMVACRFGIPHYTYNFKDRFRKEVIDRFNDAYFAGETPNPCIDCNSYIKFSALLERALSLGFDYIATGHYARVEYDGATGRYLLKKAIAEDGENMKDQSYVLYNLTQEQLSHIIFPLGNMKKAEVRRIAEENGLVNAHKPKSGYCFVSDGDYARFITEYTGKTPPFGDVTDTSGKIVGKHNGIINYTIGQRKGLGIAFGVPMYVVGKDAVNNTVIVGQDKELFHNGLIARELNWISIPELNGKLCVKAKTRYQQRERECEIEPMENGRVRVNFSQPQRAITAGQRVVFYDGDTVVGGGIIECATDFQK